MVYFDFNLEKLRKAILKLRSLGILQKDIAFACDIEPSTLSRFLSGKGVFQSRKLFTLFNYVYNELFRHYGTIQDFK